MFFGDVISTKMYFAHYEAFQKLVHLFTEDTTVSVKSKQCQWMKYEMLYVKKTKKNQGVFRIWNAMKLALTRQRRW